MRKTIFSQLDTRWGSLLYPARPYTLSTSGCGCCSVTHVIIESDKYRKCTPKNVQPYMKQFAVAGQGTKWAGITEALKHYGFGPVNHATMTDLFSTLDKRKVRLGIILFRGGTKGGITWTTSGHYIAFTDYKVKSGRHYFYMKDSGGRKHSGWYCYETQMKGLVVQCWSAKKPAKSSKTKKLRAKAKAVVKYMKDHGFRYKASWKDNALTWSGAKKKKCTNCSTMVSYVLQLIGLLKSGEYFWINGDRITCKGGLTIGRLKTIVRITHPHKPPKKAGLKKGDIVGYTKNPHTQIFAGWDSKGRPLWYSTGGNADIRSGKAHVKKSYNDKMISTIVRLK